MKKLVLKQIHQNREGSGVRLSYLLEIDRQEHVLEYFYYGIGCEIKEIPERFDPIAVMFLHAAVKYGYDLESEYPISQELYYSLTKHVIPQLVACNRSFAQTISIHAPLTAVRFHGDWRGTGVSCGLDSLATIYEYEEIPMEDYRLTHLVYLKIGQHSEEGQHSAKSQTEHFETGLENAKGFCKDAGYPLVVGESNLDEIMDKVFQIKSLLPDVVYRNAGSLLILQNYFSRYFYANSYPTLLFFSMDMNGDNAKYDRWLLPYVSTESLRFYSANTSMRRIDKAVKVSDHPLSCKYLTVCWRGTKNCGYCEKCIRTMTELDVNGLLDKYENRFDLKLFHDRKRDIYTYIYMHRSKSSFFEEIAQAMDEKQYMVPSAADYLRLIKRKLKDRPFPLSKPKEN